MLLLSLRFNIINYKFIVEWTFVPVVLLILIKDVTAAPLSILFLTLFGIIESVASLIGGFTGNYLPESAGTFMLGSKVFLLLLVIVFSLINFF